jgi:hypothetical protein
MGRTGFAWLLACLVLQGAAPARKHDPGHYLRLFDIPEVCPHLSFVMPWTLEQEVKEVVLFLKGSLSIREQYSLVKYKCKNSLPKKFNLKDFSSVFTNLIFTFFLNLKIDLLFDVHSCNREMSKISFQNCVPSRVKPPKCFPSR